MLVRTGKTARRARGRRPGLLLGALAAVILSPPAWANDAAGNTGWDEAQRLLRSTLDQYDAGNTLGALAEARELGARLYTARPAADDKTYAELTSKLSLVTIRLNHLAYGVSPELEPERFTMPVPYNLRIEREIDRYLTTDREEFARWLRRSGRYLLTLREYFRQEGLPEDLVYLALVESGFNPRNRSTKEAVGMFQFLVSTGEMVGLKQDLWIDERRSPGKAAIAAVRHLKSLYEEFKDWDLALAAYNAGSGRVWQAIKAQGTRDYWQLFLPPETEAYVPKFYATVVISREPDAYGFNPVLEAKEEYEEVAVPGGVDFKVIADCAGVTPAAVADLNTELTKGCTPPGDDSYLLRLPVGVKEKFTTDFALVPDKEKFLTPEEISRRRFKGVYVVHTVRNGENPYTIARKYRTNETKLIRWNSWMRGAKYIHPGQKIRIYRVE